MSVPLRRILEAPSLPTSFKEGKDSDDSMPIRKSLSFPDLTAMDAALSEELDKQSRIPIPPIPPPLPEIVDSPAPQKKLQQKMTCEMTRTPEKERKSKPPLSTKQPILSVDVTELHFAKQNLKKVTLGEGGKRGLLYLKSQLPSAYVAPMVNSARRMSEGAVKVEGLLKKMQHMNLSQDIPVLFQPSDYQSNNYDDDDEEAEYADAFDVQANVFTVARREGVGLSIYTMMKGKGKGEHLYIESGSPATKPQKKAGKALAAMKISEPWFFAYADRHSEEKLIWKIGLDGTFLVRKSRGRNESQPFTLTVLYEKNLFRLKIRFLPTGDYALGEKKDEEVKFPTVQALVSHYQKNPLILMGQGGGRTLLKHIPSSF